MVHRKDKRKNKRVKAVGGNATLRQDFTSRCFSLVEVCWGVSNRETMQPLRSLHLCLEARADACIALGRRCLSKHPGECTGLPRHMTQWSGAPREPFPPDIRSDETLKVHAHIQQLSTAREPESFREGCK